jgi:hypothetical protein
LNSIVVKRYSLDKAAPGMFENVTGGYVKHKDHVAYVAQLHEQAAAWRQALAHEAHVIGSRLRDAIPALPLETANAIQVELNRLDEVAERLQGCKA